MLFYMLMDFKQKVYAVYILLIDIERLIFIFAIVKRLPDWSSKQASKQTSKQASKQASNKQ